jgi:hypothetical protein
MSCHHQPGNWVPACVPGIWIELGGVRANAANGSAVVQHCCPLIFLFPLPLTLMHF